MNQNATFKELLDYLNTRPEMVEAVKGKRNHVGAMDLRENVEKVISMSVNDCHVEVFVNGYAVYDNGDRKTVIWVPNCNRIVYKFTPLTDKEKQYMTNKEEIEGETVGTMTWYIPIVVHGENQIEYNLEHPKSGESASDQDAKFCLNVTPALDWARPAHIEGPEEAFLRKEARAERMARLTEKQREVYEMYYEENYTEEEIAEILGVAHQTVSRYLKRISKVLEKTF